jgi:hypothetical protein
VRAPAAPWVASIRQHLGWYSVASASTGLAETLSTSKSSYKAGETVYITGACDQGMAWPSRGPKVSFSSLKPNKVNTIEQSATTDSNGYAKVSFVSGTGPSSIGTYQVTAVATSGSLTKTTTSSFSVYK